MALPRLTGSHLLSPELLSKETERLRGKTCPKAQALFWNCFSAEAINSVAPDALRQGTFSFETAPSRLAESVPFVCAVLRVNGSIRVPKEMVRNPVVARVDAVSKLIFNKEISRETESNLRNIGAAPFLSALKALEVKDLPSYDNWREHGLGGLFEVGKGFQNDREVVLCALKTYCTSYTMDKLLTALEENKSILLKDGEVIRAMLKKDFQATIRVLEKLKSPFLKDLGLIINNVIPHAQHTDAETILNVVKEAQPHLLNNEEFVTAMMRLNPGKTVIFLNDVGSTLLGKPSFLLNTVQVRNPAWLVPIIACGIEGIGSDLLNDEAFVISMMELDFMKTLQTLKNIRSPLFKSQTFIGAFMQIVLGKSLNSDEAKKILDIIKELNPDLLRYSEFIGKMLEINLVKTIELVGNSILDYQVLREGIIKWVKPDDVVTILYLLKEMQSDLLNDRDVMVAMIKADIDKSIGRLETEKSPLLNDPIFVKEMLNIDFNVLERHTYLVKYEVIVNTMLDLGFIKTLQILKGFDSSLLSDSKFIASIVGKVQSAEEARKFLEIARGIKPYPLRVEQTLFLNKKIRGKPS
jgi:hypothetical protein